jgi:hypothetical protein
MDGELIAPCGMNCLICAQHLALEHNIKSKGIKMPYCTGCRPRDKNCAFLKKRCDLLNNSRVTYCYECIDFPCERLKRLDKRCRTYFGMSMIENLEYIKNNGISQFLVKEQEKWKCPECGGLICCHNGICFDCGFSKLKNKKRLYRWED